MSGKYLHKILTILTFFYCAILADQHLDFLTCELTYYRTSNLYHGIDMVNCKDSIGTDTIVCRIVSDTMINGIEVFKYRYISSYRGSIDTSYDYRHVTDTSNVNYAWQGNTPYVLLKRTARLFRNDSLYLEASPYTSYIFPLQPGTTWLTRPESTGLYTVKTYQAEDSVRVGAGIFLGKKVHAEILKGLGLDSVFADQWVFGNVVVKSFINYGLSAGIYDTNGNPVDSACKLRYWELFELKSFANIPTVKYERQIKENQSHFRVSLEKEKLKIQFLPTLQNNVKTLNMFTLSGKVVLAQSTFSDCFFINIKGLGIPNGHYVLRIISGNEKRTLPLLIWK
jgi:hypothetical protein